MTRLRLCPLRINTESFFVSQQCKELEGSALAEMQREIEDLRLRLQMAAEHYKDKYKECQKLQKHVCKITDQQGVSELQFIDFITQIVFCYWTPFYVVCLR